MRYEAFRKDFYKPDPAIAGLSASQVSGLRAIYRLKVTGENIPTPIKEFSQAHLPFKVIKALKKKNIEKPTAIQAQALPAALSGRDIIGVAQTGSGKTLAFVLPCVIHMIAQRVIEPGEGPIGLVLAPTRELVTQIHSEAKRHCKALDMTCLPIYGGASKWEQQKALRKRPELVVGTPGRLIDLVKCKALSLARVTYLVLDEADRMFDMGFEVQVRSIVNQTRPDRQTLLFSATFK